MAPFPSLHRSRAFCACLVLATLLVPVRPAGAQTTDADLQRRLARAGVSEAIVASCSGEIRVGHRSETVAALGSTTSGRYVLLQDDDAVTVLETYDGAPELHCYTIREADRLTAQIAASDTINGRITAEWDGLVVCASISPTTSVCWQHAMERKAFARIGGWTRQER